MSKKKNRMPQQKKVSAAEVVSVYSISILFLLLGIIGMTKGAGDPNASASLSSVTHILFYAALAFGVFLFIVGCALLFTVLRAKKRS
ncbi:MAG: hypothetical protein SOR89_01425 [Ndongobacter sp.]|nr:hypothetical protein [Ndongobacter sp.]